MLCIRLHRAFWDSRLQRSAITRFLDPAKAEDTITRLNGSHLDRNHQMTLEKIDVSEGYRLMQNIIPEIEQQQGLMFLLDMETELFQEV